MLSILLLSIAASPLPAPGGWEQSNVAFPETKLQVTIALLHTDEAEAKLEATFNAVSDPDHSSYGEHLSKAEVSAMLPPVDGAVEATMAWCDTHGFECNLSGTGDVVTAVADVGTLGHALGVKLERYTHPTLLATTAIFRTMDVVQMPRVLAKFVRCITQLETFPDALLLAASKSPLRKRNANAPQVNPALLKGSTLYNITDNATAGSKASMAVVEFQGQGYLPKDLALFEASEGLPPQACRNITGPADTTKTAGVEASLDIQYVIAAGTGVPADFWLDSSGSFDLMGWATYVEGLSNPALVWSMSYGEGVNGGNGGTIPPSQVKALNLEMQKFGVRGLSVLIASGDSGVYNRIPFEKGHFHPSYPACLPGVTAVGATELNADGSEDTAVSFSGGGFTPSNYFDRSNATWQETAVQHYLMSGVQLPPSKYWDKNGRGIPDVSAVGVDFAVYTDGNKQGVSGTSASTPVVAGIFALLNDVRLSHGLPPLGFLNPFIYKNANNGFRDIKKGYNNGGGIPALKKGFYATDGWDPVTGVGTPNYPALKKAALQN